MNAGGGTGGSADLVFVGGIVRTVDGATRPAEAVAVKDGRIVAVGSDVEIVPAIGAATQVVDLQGRALLPGFIDSHTHAFLTGIALRSADLQGSQSVAEVCRRVEAQARKTPRGEWVYGFNCPAWTQVWERRFPTMAELDQVSGDHPVYIVADSFHSGAANTDGFALIAPPESLGGVERDARGKPTGSFLTDDAHFHAARMAYGGLGEAAIADMFRDVATSAARRGVTTLHCLDGQFMADDLDVTVLLGLQEELDVHTVVMYQTMDVERVLQLGLPRIGGCLTVDGAGFERTALFYEPYEGTTDVYGDLYIAEDKLDAFVLEAHTAGLQVGVHAIGDRAVDLAVGAYKKALEAVPRADARHRVEHFYVPTDWAIEQAQALGLALPMQPAFSWSCDVPGRSEYEEYWGKERADRAEPFPRLCELGIVVSGGSDSPITPIDPLLGIHSAVNNPNPIRRVGVDDAVRMFTANGAWVGREEREKGSIEAGKLADLVVLEHDPYEAQSVIKDIPVQMTVCAGRITWSAL